MKKYWVIVLAVVFVLSIGGYVAAQQFAGPWTGMGRGHMAPGMMGGGGPGYSHMGPGMMGQGSMGPGMMGGATGPGTSGCPGMSQQLASTGPITKEQVTARVQNHLTAMGNPNLKLGTVNETPTQIEVEIVTKDNSLVEKIQVDKTTGRTTRAF